ncbi:MAG: hypothetical protein OEU26_14110 [Candidatus Tectomicrobia bacterium]|nr:hypothetical protein [Candidatus Tectomicrobia bacterium]
MKHIGLILFLAFFSCQSLWAATVFTFKTKDLGSLSSETQQMKITADVDTRRLRIDSDPDDSLIYRGDLPEQTVLIVDHPRRSTQRMNREQMQGMANQMQQMMQQMQAQMKNMPPEVQKKFRDMQTQQQSTDAKMPSGSARTIKLTKKRETVGKYRCNIYEMHRDEMMTEICATPWKQVKNGRAAFELFQEMFELQREMMQAFASGMPRSGPRPEQQQNSMMDIDMQQGFPVQVKLYEKGQLTHSSQLESVAETSQLDAKFFDSPDGYETKSFGMQNGMKRR